ncbi:MAG: serine--tRNA ligase [Bdellovibrionaceae bacterium]|jgi:seryl-tRNA synthetase|nr:serine--tRNA ligase [Pseudobdellovibrionaceae bacterium]
MIDIKKIEKNEVIPGWEKGYKEVYRSCLANRGEDVALVDRALEYNQKRKEIVQFVEATKSEQNKMSQEIVKLKKAGEDASGILKEMQKLSAQGKEKGKELEGVESELNNLMQTLPNICHFETPMGASEAQNVEKKVFGEKPSFDFKIKDHVDLGENLGILDFETAGKVTGARFSYLKGKGALLERALTQFMLNMHTIDHAYEEISTPFIVNATSMYGTGQLPKFKDDAFQVSDTDFFLIPTAEVPVTNYYAKEILAEEDLPKYFVAGTPCFRSEAGSYGKDTRGLFRQHQFIKVELMKFAHPDNSYEEHEKLTQNAEKVLEALGLHYRRMELCTGDMGYGAAKCFDLEVWLPGQDQFREISSCSNFEDFQARRANIRFRPKGGKPQFVHTINGSGLAVGRTLIAVLENYQNKDGSIEVPEVLRPYMAGLKSITL